MTVPPSGVVAPRPVTTTRRASLRYAADLTLAGSLGVAPATTLGFVVGRALAVLRRQVEPGQTRADEPVAELLGVLVGVELEVVELTPQALHLGDRGGDVVVGVRVAGEVELRGQQLVAGCGHLDVEVRRAAGLGLPGVRPLLALPAGRVRVGSPGRAPVLEIVNPRHPGVIVRAC